MNTIQQKLLVFFWGLLGASGLLVLLAETEMIVLPVMSSNGVFISQVLLELFSIVCIPLALRLFTFDRIHQELINRKEKALLKWGLVRLSLLQIPMFANLVCYYQSYSPAFAYLAIILFLCLFFVNPSKERCNAEINNNSEK